MNKQRKECYGQSWEKDNKVCEQCEDSYWCHRLVNKIDKMTRTNKLTYINDSSRFGSLIEEAEE